MSSTHSSRDLFSPGLIPAAILCVWILAGNGDLSTALAGQATPATDPSAVGHPPAVTLAATDTTSPTPSAAEHKVPAEASGAGRNKTSPPEGGRVKPMEGKTLYSFEAENEDLKTALATFARANNLNIVPDNDVSGKITVNVHDLSLPEMMKALLEASDCVWTETGGLIRVHTTETRTFKVDYLRMIRTGIGQNSATLGSGTSGGGGSGGGGGSSGGGGATSFGSANSSVNVTADNPVDFWSEITTGIEHLLTPAGKSALAINKTAGIVQITDRPSALKRVESFLKNVDQSVHRQVEIEARLYNVTLNHQFQFGIDWVQLARAYGGTFGFGASTLPVPIGGSQLLDSSLSGLNRYGIIGTSAATTPGGNLSSLMFQNFHTEAAVNALKQQGNVQVIATPRIRTLNNQTALIKVGEEVPFFNTSTTVIPGTTAGTSDILQQTIVNSITIGTILTITPQISGDGWISLDISPVLTSLKAVVSSAESSGGGSSGGSSGGSGSGATAPDLNTKQASTIVRVRNGTTVVMGGLIQTQKARNEKKVPLLGDIPWFGKLFTGTFNYNEKQELVIFVTPHIIGKPVPGGRRQVTPPMVPQSRRSTGAQLNSSPAAVVPPGLSPEQTARLNVLLYRYMQGKLTEDEYHEARQKILQQNQ